MTNIKTSKGAPTTPHSASGPEEKATKAANVAKEKASKAADATKEKAEKAADATKEKAVKAGNTTKEEKSEKDATAIEEKASKTARATKEKAEKTAAVTKEKAAKKENEATKPTVFPTATFALVCTNCAYPKLMARSNLTRKFKEATRVATGRYCSLSPSKVEVRLREGSIVINGTIKVGEEKKAQTLKKVKSKTFAEVVAETLGRVPGIEAILIPGGAKKPVVVTPAKEKTLKAKPEKASKATKEKASKEKGLTTPSVVVPPGDCKPPSLLNTHMQWVGACDAMKDGMDDHFKQVNDPLRGNGTRDRMSMLHVF